MARPQSNKNKGRLGQQEISRRLLEEAKALGADATEDDFRSNPMGSDGEDILLSSVSRKLFPWNIEIKRKKKSTVEGWMDQARTHGTHEPIVFSRQDHKKWVVSVDIDYFFKLYKQAKKNEH